MKIFEKRNIKVVVSENVLETLKSYIQNISAKNEAGGILLGQVVNNIVYIIRASVPNQFDKASRYGFIRNKDVAQIIADFEYINSDKRTIYVGEWHTHPEDLPTPSGQDIKMIKDQYISGKNLHKDIFLIIQGRKGLYVGTCNGKELKEMIEIK